jgi:hypothetical protein
MAVVRARPRSRTSRTGFSHDAHPRQHEPGCGVTERGRISYEVCVLDARYVSAEYYSCIEPDGDVVAAVCTRA